MVQLDQQPDRPCVLCSAHLGELQNKDFIREPQAFCFKDIFLGVLLEFLPIDGTIFQSLKFLPNVECAWDIILNCCCPIFFTPGIQTPYVPELEICLI